MKTVLVVDDSEGIRELYVEVLEGAGYRVLGAEHGGHALAILESMHRKPSLVLLDMLMPVMDGQAFLSRVQEIPELASVPIVVISTMMSQPSSGVRRVVQKPSSPDAIKALVREFCGVPSAYGGQT